MVQDFGHPHLLVSRGSLGLPLRDPHSGAFVFACFNKHVKIRRELFDIWCQTLMQLPNARLVALTPNLTLHLTLTRLSYNCPTLGWLWLLCYPLEPNPNPNPNPNPTPHPKT